MPVPISEQAIDSWSSLNDAIDDVFASQSSTWFRGQSRWAWRLAPSINRYVQALTPADATGMEFSAIMRFMSEAHAQLPPTALPRDPFGWEAFDNYVEWLALMQHHGAPTRLLDWSLSPYVALYFAVCDDADHDAALWYFDHRRSWDAFCARFGVRAQDVFDYRVLPSTLLTAPPAPQPFLFAATKKMRSAREVAQQGVFTFCDHLLADHQDVLAEIAGGSCGRLRIPATLKPEIRARLRVMNITPAALFPGVDGVCQSIRQDFDQQRLFAAWRASASATPTGP